MSQRMTTYREVSRFGDVFVSAYQRPNTYSRLGEAYVTLAQPAVNEEGFHQPAASVTIYVSSPEAAQEIADFFTRLRVALKGTA